MTANRKKSTEPASDSPSPAEPGSVCLTHRSGHCKPPWLAIHRDSALELLKDYNLTEAQKTDCAALMAGYCNLLDYAGLLFYGQSEAEAVTMALGLSTPNGLHERPGANA